MRPVQWFHNILFKPRVTFTALYAGSTNTADKSSPSLLPILLMVFAIAIIRGLFLPGIHSIAEMLASGFFYGVMSVAAWLVTSLVYTLAAVTFGKPARLRTFLILTACAVLPWLFTPVAVLFGNIEPYVIGKLCLALAMLAIWAWSAWLFVLAIKTTWQLSKEQVLGALCLPISLGAIYLIWSGSFFYNLLHCFS